MFKKHEISKRVLLLKRYTPGQQCGEAKCNIFV